MYNFNHTENKTDLVQVDKHILVSYCALPLNSIQNNIELNNSGTTDT